jgi:hypothetical protein
MLGTTGDSSSPTLTDFAGGDQQTCDLGDERRSRLPSVASNSGLSLQPARDVLSAGCREVAADKRETADRPPRSWRISGAGNRRDERPALRSTRYLPKSLVGGATATTR